MINASGGADMVFLVRPDSPSYEAQIHAHALEEWRVAERLLRERWNGFVEADRESRPGAFAAYTAALDAEAAAAASLATLQPARAA